MTYYYSYEKLNEYSYEISCIRNLEDAPDVVYTLEEMKEILGGDFYGHGGVCVLKSKVVAALTEIKNKMIADNKKSCVIKDTALVDTLKASYQSVSTYVKGLRRVGNRLSIHDNSSAEEKKRARMLLGQMIWRGTRIFGKKTKLEVDIKYIDKNPIQAMNIVKSLITIDDLIQNFKDDVWAYQEVTEADHAIVREMWEDVGSHINIPEQTA